MGKPTYLSASNPAYQPMDVKPISGAW
ncbi:hypothetical protein [Halomonas sp. N3-2A]